MPDDSREDEKPDDSHEQDKKKWQSENRMEKAVRSLPLLEQRPTAWDRILAARATTASESDFDTWWELYGRHIRTENGGLSEGEDFRRRLARAGWEVGIIAGQGINM